MEEHHHAILYCHAIIMQLTTGFPDYAPRCKTRTVHCTQEGFKSGSNCTVTSDGFWNNYYFFDPTGAVSRREVFPIAPGSSRSTFLTFCQPFFHGMTSLQSSERLTVAKNHRS